MRFIAFNTTQFSCSARLTGATHKSTNITTTICLNCPFTSLTRPASHLHEAMTATAAGTELQEQQGELQAGNKQPSAAEAAETAQNQALVCVPRTSSPHAHSSSNSSSRAPSSTTPAALYRYQHYASTLGRELALLVLCHGSAGLAAAVRVSLRLTRVLGLQLQHWLSHSQLAKAAADALVRALRALRTLLQQHVALPLGRLLTQLVWVQVQLSTDDVLDEGVALAARLNSCVSLLFGSIR